VKIVRENLLEKFVEDSDPIADMGIGNEFENLRAGDILKVKRPIHGYNENGFLILTADIEKRPEGVEYSHDIYTYYVSNKLALINFAKQNPDLSKLGMRLGLRWAMDSKFFKKILKKMPYTLNDIVKNPDVKLLEKFTEDSDPITDMGIGVRHQISKWMKSNDQLDTDDNALIQCAKYGKSEWLEFLLNRGADVHSDGDNALRCASYYGDVEVVKILLNAGADVHADNDWSLRAASENGHAKVVELLLNAGADVNANNGIALRWAIKYGPAEVVKILKDHMKKNPVKESLHEKFTEDSDPISDLGIGLNTKHIINILLKNDVKDLMIKFIVTAAVGKPHETGSYFKIIVPPRVIENGKKLTLSRKLDYIKEVIKNSGLDFIFLKYGYAYHSPYMIDCKIKPEHRNKFKPGQYDIDLESRRYIDLTLHEKFTEDSDPIDDLGIGTRHLISKWMKEKREEDTADNALIQCSRYGKTEWVEYLLNIGANVHTMDDFALQWASGNGHAEVVKLLLNAGANAHADDDYALRWASYRNRVEIVKLLKDHMKKMRVKESLHEKFTEDSDPIKDLGIGEEALFKRLKRGDILQLKEEFDFSYAVYKRGAYIILLRDIKKLDELSDTKEDLYEIVYLYTNNKRKIKKLIQFFKKNSDPQVTDMYRILGATNVKWWSIDFSFYKEAFIKIDKDEFLKESLNEKFTEDSDPIKDMGIGMIQKALKTNTSYFTDEEYANWLVNLLPIILDTDEIPEDILGKVFTIDWKYFPKINEFINNKRINKSDRASRSWLYHLDIKLKKLGFKKIGTTSR